MRIIKVFISFLCLVIIVGLTAYDAGAGVIVQGNALYDGCQVGYGWHKKDMVALHSADSAYFGPWVYVGQTLPHNYYLANVNGQSGWYFVKCTHFLTGHITWHGVYLYSGQSVWLDIHPCANQITAPEGGGP